MNTASSFAEVNPIESTEFLTQKPFAQVPNRAIEDAISGEIPLEVFRFYCWLCKVSNHQGRSWWSVKRQAEEFNVSTRTISRWRAILAEKRYIWLRKQMGHATITIVLDYPQRSAPTERSTKVADNDPTTLGEETETKSTRKDVDDPTKTTTCVEEDTSCPVEEDTPCPVEEDTVGVTLKISKKNKQRTIAAAKTELTKEPDSAAATNWDGERWEHVCSVFADIGVDLRVCRAYVFQRPEETEELRTAWDGALRHCAWVLAGRIQRSLTPIGAPLRVTIVMEALDTAPAEPELTEQVSEPQGVESPARRSQSNFAAWAQILASIEEKITDSTFNRWFKYMGAELNNGEVTFVCEDEFDAGFVEKNFTELLQIHLKRVGIEGSLRFTYDSDAERVGNEEQGG